MGKRYKNAEERQRMAEEQGSYWAPDFDDCDEVIERMIEEGWLEFYEQWLEYISEYE